MKSKNKQEAAGASGKKSGKSVWIILSIMAVVLLVVFGAVIAGSILGGGGVPVSVATVSQSDIAMELNYSGTVETKETKVYFSPVTASVASVYVEAGDLVASGDKLLDYDVAQLEEQNEEAKLQAKAENYGIDATVKELAQSVSEQNEAVGKYDEAIRYVNHYSACLESANAQYQEAMSVKAEYDALKAQVDQYKIQQADREEPNKELASLIKKGEKKLEKLKEQVGQYDYAALEGAVTTCSNELNEYKAQAEQYKAQQHEDASAGSRQAQQSVLREINNLGTQKAEENLAKAKEGCGAAFRGVVSELAVVPGQGVSEGMELLSLQSMEDLKVVIKVNKFDLEQLAVGMESVVSVGDREYRGKVEKINKMAQVDEKGAVTVNAEIHIENPDDLLYLGVEAKVKIKSASEKDALVVPLQCVNYDTKGAFCYVAEDGVLKRRDVTVGISSDTEVQIIAGLKKGDQVVSEITTGLEEGMEVTPVEENSGDGDAGTRDSGV